MSKFAKLKQISKKHAAIGVLFALLLFVILIGEQTPEAIVPEPSEVTTEYVQEVASEFVAAGGNVEPQVLRIPKLDLTVRFGEQLGIQVNGEVEVPEKYEEVGWYQHSPVPGDIGPAVVLGHVDSLDGPAVFYSIGQLEVGDEVIVERSDGQGVVFEITKSEKYEQNSFPTELVYGDIDHAGLRLVTCSGWYDRENQRYSHNRVVFAKLKT